MLMHVDMTTPTDDSGQSLPPLPKSLPTKYETEVYTHISMVSVQSPSSYDRLACLGNAILNLVVTQNLFDYEPKIMRPGQIAETRQEFVSHETIKTWAMRYNLH